MVFILLFKQSTSASQTYNAAGFVREHNSFRYVFPIFYIDCYGYFHIKKTRIFPFFDQGLCSGGYSFIMIFQLFEIFHNLPFLSFFFKTSYTKIFLVHTAKIFLSPFCISFRFCGSNAQQKLFNLRHVMNCLRIFEIFLKFSTIYLF